MRENKSLSNMDLDKSNDGFSRMTSSNVSVGATAHFSYNNSS